jgi:hypothetical protein
VPLTAQARGVGNFFYSFLKKFELFLFFAVILVVNVIMKGKIDG